MSEVTIDKAFVEEFNGDVHVAYQRKGSQLRNTVRRKADVKGKSTTFQKVGKGKATSKGGPGSQIVPMNLDHEPVRCDLIDRYAGEWVDELDELKINHDEKMVVVDAIVEALGRESDDLIINAAHSGIGNGVKVLAHGGVGLTKAKVQSAFAYMGNKHVPGPDRVCLVGPQQWNDLLDIDAFSNADYIGQDDLPWKGGAQAKKWLGTTFMMFDGLKLTGTTRYAIWYQKRAIGHAIGKEVSSKWSYENTHGAFFCNGNMSQGACLIDAEGLVIMECVDNSEAA